MATAKKGIEKKAGGKKIAGKPAGAATGAKAKAGKQAVVKKAAGKPVVAKKRADKPVDVKKESGKRGVAKKAAKKSTVKKSTATKNVADKPVGTKKAVDKKTIEPISDGKNRCYWCGNDPLYMEYHDKEWGREVHDDKVLFEFLLLEGAQAGLSWITILRRRENYRKAFAGFDVAKVAKFTDKDKARLLLDEGIIRNKLKIEAAVKNAQLFIEVQKEFGSFDKYLYSFIPGGNPVINHPKRGTIQPRTELSDAISKDMKKRGFKFFGTTICYAHMQATGMVNDHTDDCDFK